MLFVKSPHRVLLLLLLLLVLWTAPALAAVPAGNRPVPPIVRETEAESLIPTLQKLPASSSALILFYVSWCPWSRKMLPVFDQLPEALSNSKLPTTIELWRVRMDRAPQSVHTHFDVFTYPKLVLVEGGATGGKQTAASGKQTAVEGSMELKDVLRWLHKATNTAIILSEASQLDFYLKNQGPDSLAVFANTQPLPASQLHAHVLPLATTSHSVVESLLKFLARTPSAAKMVSWVHAHKAAPFVTVFHPFGNDPPVLGDKSGGGFGESGMQLFGGSNGGGDLVNSGREGGDGGLQNAALDFIKSVIESDFEDDQIEHITYARDHIDNAAQVFPEDPKTAVKAAEVAEFIDKFSFPMVTKWNADSAARIMETGKPLLVAMSPSPTLWSGLALMSQYDGDDSHMEADGRMWNNTHIEGVLWELGKQWRGSFVTALSGTLTLSERRLMGMLSVEAAPALVYLSFRPSGSGSFAPALKYIAPPSVVDQLFHELEANRNPTRPSQVDSPSRVILDVEAAAGAISGWVRSVREGSVQPNVKSEEPIERALNRGPVFYLTAREFTREVVEATQHDYLVDFFAPWCGHCRVLAPVFSATAQAFLQAGIPIRFGKMDATANEILGLPIRGYPTLLFYPAGNQQPPVVMDANPISPRDIIDWLAKHTNRPFDSEYVANQLKQLVNPNIPQVDDEL